MGNTFGELFRVSTFGESHGPAVGCAIDGCPPRIPVTVEDIQRELDRRRPGGALATPRKEEDRVEVLSGIRDGVTLGTPIALLVRNAGQRSADYDALAGLYRPSHADFTTQAKYGIRDPRGGGRASSRETAARVAAGAVAGRLLSEWAGICVAACVVSIGEVRAAVRPGEFSAEAAEASPVRCPDPVASEAMVRLIERVRGDDDSIGGVVECVATGVPPGLGDPVFDKLESDLAKALLSIPACRGFEVGSGFACAAMRGSEHNDPFVMKEGRVGTLTNHSGGIQGGISNGEPILLRVPFKAPSSIARSQRTVTMDGRETAVEVRGRHDPCIVPRAVPIVEAMVRLVLADHLLRQRAIEGPPPAKGAVR